MILDFGGGLNEIEPHLLEALDGYNFDLQRAQTKLRPRRPFDKKGTAPNAGDVRGLLQLVKRSGSQTSLVQAGASVYLWDGASTFTSSGTVISTSQLRGVTWPLGDYLVITDRQKLTVVKKWDGTTFSTLTTGLGTDLYAKYAVVHLGRVWLFNVKTSSDTPHLMVGSAFEDPTSYSTAVRATIDSFVTGREAFYMLTPDLRPINGVALFHDQLIVSTEAGRLFKLTGSSARDFAWSDFYAGSAAVGDESIANVGNDVMFMRKGGNIESLIATDRFGDVSADDVSRWIPDTVKDLTGCIAVYDQTLQKVLFFVSGKVLVLFKDLLAEGVKGERLSPWTVYTTLHSSGFNTSAAQYMYMPGTTDSTVYFGDNAGNIYDLNGSGSSGDGAANSISLLRKSRLMDDAVINPWPWNKKPVTGRVQYRRIGQCDITISFDWAEEYNESDCTVTLKGPPAGDTGAYFGGPIYFGGAFYFNQGAQFADKISSKGFSPIGKSPGFFLSVSSENNVRYEVDHILMK